MKNLNVLTDEELALAYIDGDNSAFDELLSRNQSKLFSYILFVVRDEDKANDLFQETFVKVITKLHEKRYVDSGKFSAWIMRIAHNVMMDWYREQIAACTYREFTTGFFYGRPDETAQIYDSNTYRKGYTYLGMVNGVAKDGCIETEQRNKFSVGERIEIMKPDGSNPEAEVLEIRDADGTPMESAPHPQQKLLVKLSCQAARYDILRRREQENG